MKYFLLIGLLFSLSCVEHKFFIELYPGGNFLFDYKAHGDEKDLFDNDFPIPKGNEWSSKSSLEIGTSDTQEYTAYREFKKNELIPSSFYKGDSISYESLLLHPIKVNYNNWFFFKTYNFDAIFKNREINLKYPKVNSIIIDPESPIEGWTIEIIRYLLMETLNRTPLGFNKKAMLESELRLWFDSEFNTLTDSIILESFDDYKQRGLDIIMYPVSSLHYNYMDSVFTVLEDEINITLDLIDDEFSFKAIIPGNNKITNCDSVIVDTMFWNFRLNNFANNDFLMIGKSKIILYNRVIMGFIFAIVLLTIGLFRQKK